VAGCVRTRRPDRPYDLGLSDSGRNALTRCRA
jgi:hypothetical protein